MAPKNSKQWGRSTNVHPKRQSFESYIEGAAGWAKQNRTTQCNTCGERTTHTDAEIIGRGITTAFTCDSGHITKQTTKERELRRAYNTRD